MTVDKPGPQADGLIRPDELSDHVRARLQAILAVVQLEVDGEPVEIDGFRFAGRKEKH